MSFTRGNTLVRPVHPARAMDRPWRAGLLASGSSRGAPPSRASAQWRDGAPAIRLQLREQHRPGGRSAHRFPSWSRLRDPSRGWPYRRGRRDASCRRNL